MSLEIFIGAGVALSASNTEAFSSGTQSLLFNGLNAAWKAADARLFSLETPLADASACEVCACATCAPRCLRKRDSRAEPDGGQPLHRANRVLRRGRNP